MKVLYRPKGRAGEYSPWAVNLYTGCTHGCTYCYAPAVLRMDRVEFHDRPHVRIGVIDQLYKDVVKIPFDQRNEHVLLCLATDPYQDIFDTTPTREAIKILNGAGWPVRILTKGGKIVERDFDFLEQDQRNEFGVTLTCYHGMAEEHKWEPRAACTTRRIANLQRAKQFGIRTWVSLEPVIDPNNAIALIHLTHDFVDRYTVGKLNYHPHAKTVNWPAFCDRVISKLEEVGAEYYIKKDLMEAK